MNSSLHKHITKTRSIIGRSWNPSYPAFSGDLKFLALYDNDISRDLLGLDTHIRSLMPLPSASYSLPNVVPPTPKVQLLDQTDFQRFYSVKAPRFVDSNIQFNNSVPAFAWIGPLDLNFHENLGLTVGIKFGVMSAYEMPFLQCETRGQPVLKSFTISFTGEDETGRLSVSLYPEMSSTYTAEAKSVPQGQWVSAVRCTYAYA